MGARIGHYGGAFANIDRANRNPLEVFKSFGPHKGLPSRGDVPHLLRMLEVVDARVAGEAHRALVWITGVDCGRDAVAWQRWWREHGSELAGVEKDREAVRNLFRALKGDLLTGRWAEAVGRLSTRVRATRSDEERAGFIGRYGQLLRKVYRDARAELVSVNGDRGRISVNWGELGFEFTDIEVVRDPEGWRMDRLPWARRVVRSHGDVHRAAEFAGRVLPVVGGRRAVVPESAPGSMRHTRWRWRINTGGLIAVVIAAGLVFGALHVIFFGGAEARRWVLGLGVMALVGAAPLMLFCGMIFDRFRGSREIRRDLGELTGRYAPHARGRR